MQQSLLGRIIQFAAHNDAVSALILVGSRAREENPADAYSDTDLIMVAEDAAYFVASDSWLEEIGNFHISFSEPTVDGQKERRVLFDDAQDVDFVILEKEAAVRALVSGEAAGILANGYRVLVNKTGLQLPPPVPAAVFIPATEADFCNTVNDFWYHTVWTAKKLLRHELWTAKFCVDMYLKWKLLWIIEQYEHTVRRSGRYTWYRGRFIERWAANDILADLQSTFAHYDPADMAKALIQTMALFRRLSVAVAEASGFAYPAHADEYATKWVLSSLAPLIKEGDAL
ncbi:MAG TPA: aminoglycoside 6-adenylyltransferase [Candidatus Limiplasma sp.]|nr:aminoglycoside 6-adenylyltransferase [Candidatus Limiplasma sp.]